MLAASVIAYLLFSLVVGLWAARKVRSEQDFISAGRSLGLPIATTTVFATWFGSESVLGASSSFSEEGIRGVVEDPLGASLCLLLVGLFFARPLYRMNLLTFGDFYRVTFGKTAEFVAGAFLVISYIGWVAAQMVAAGIVIHAVIPSVSIFWGIIISSVIVLMYTSGGGMWSVSITDFLQTTFIIIGLLASLFWILPRTEGVTATESYLPSDFFSFNPNGSFSGWIEHFAAWITIGLGSIPQQDVYQRVMAARDERTAVRSTFLGAFMYLTIALIPLVLVLCALKLGIQSDDSQMLVPALILQQTPVFIQILFFGALLSAILSTASGALLAPSVILSENLVLPRLRSVSAERRILITRICVVLTGAVSLIMALSRQNIYELVGEASVISLVGLFVPLCAGLFLKNRNERAAVFSMISGTAAWLVTEYIGTEIPSLLYGLITAVISMALISVLLRSPNKQ